jgi:hypothetical protein
MLAFSVLLETHCVLRYFSPLRLWNSERFWPRFFALHHSEFSLEIQPGISACSLNAGLPRIPEIPFVAFEARL